MRIRVWLHDEEDKAHRKLNRQLIAARDSAIRDYFISRGIRPLAISVGVAHYSAVPDPRGTRVSIDDHGFYARCMAKMVAPMKAWKQRHCAPQPQSGYVTSC